MDSHAGRAPQGDRAVSADPSPDSVWLAALGDGRLRLLTGIESAMLRQAARQEGRPVEDLVRETYRRLWGQKMADGSAPDFVTGQ